MSDNVITVYAENQTMLKAQDIKTVYAVLFGFMVSNVQNQKTTFVTILMFV